MAKVEFEAFVDKNLGWGLKTTEKHRKKDGDEWVDAGRTFRTVKAAYGVPLDLGVFPEGSRVLVSGTEVTESREYQGKTFYDLVVKAKTVEAVQRGGSGVASVVDAGPVWGTADETPF